MVAPMLPFMDTMRYVGAWDCRSLRGALGRVSSSSKARRDAALAAKLD